MNKLATALALLSLPAISQDRDARPIRHVLLLSVDGMHAVDYLNCSHGIAGVNNGEPYCPNLAALGMTGVNYVAASTSKPSDSFPGLTALVSGGTPRTTGVYYDVAFDRSLDQPLIASGNGNLAGPCTPYGVATGATTEYEEGIDLDQSKLNGGAPGAGLTDGGIAAIDPKKLVRNPAKGCAPVYPWDFVRANSIFSVVHKAGGYTAWSDKHPVYASVAGPGGKGLDDYYSPEINSTVIGLPGVTTSTGVSCASIVDATQTASWTNSFANIRCYDQLKVNAILKQIDGKTHNGANAKTPALFGMNFQAVSVGQKLIVKNVATGGYQDSLGTPTASLLGEIEFVDAAIGDMVAELKRTGRYDSTLIVVTAKHGQSPIDPKAFFPIPGPTGKNGAPPSSFISGLLPDSELNGIGPTEDDISLLWLKDSSQTNAAVTTLEANRTAAGIGQIFSGPTLALNYGTPGLPPYGDPRTPDIIVQPIHGVVYTGSSKKLSEHGGFDHDDTNVIMLLANPYFSKQTVYAAVETTQVAPTILKALGLDPMQLDAVQAEGTAVLPAVQFAQEY